MEETILHGLIPRVLLFYVDLAPLVYPDRGRVRKKDDCGPVNAVFTPGKADQKPGLITLYRRFRRCRICSRMAASRSSTAS